jgi:hypothetical protein
MRVSTAELSLANEDRAQPPYLRWPALAEPLLEGDLDDALAVVTLGGRIQRARQAALVHAMLGLSLQQRGLERTLALVPSAAVTPGQARDWIATLDTARPDGESWGRVWAGEYWQMRGTWVWALEHEAASSGWPPSSYVLHPNRSLQRLADLFRELQRDSAVVCAKLRPREREEYRTQQVARVLGPNSIGEILLAVAAPSFDGLQRRRCALESTFSAAQLAIALEAWRDEHGDLPEQLEQLAPAYFTVLPVDGVRGEPLRYARYEPALYAPAAGAPLRFDLGL